MNQLNSDSSINIDLYHGDCLEVMPKLPSHSIDMILADLPYGVTNAKWDSVIPLHPLWKQYKRLIKDHGAIVLFGAEPFSSNLRMSNVKMYRYDWIWKKKLATLFLQAHHRPLRDFENIMVFYKHLPTYNPQMRYGFKPYKGSHQKKHHHYKHRSGVFTSKNLKNVSNGSPNGARYPIDIISYGSANHSHRYHPTQKPTDLLRYLIKTYTNKNDLILDNVMGSGSTGVACRQLHRNFIGIEKTEHYYKIAKKRISRA